MKIGTTYLVRNLETDEIKLVTLRRRVGAYVELMVDMSPVWMSSLKFQLAYEILETMGVDKKNIYALFDIHGKRAEQVFNIPSGELTRKVRTRGHVDARKCVMFTLRGRYGFSLNQIAEAFQWNDGTPTDHSTVLHNIERAENFINTDKVFREKLEVVYNLSTDES